MRRRSPTAGFEPTRSIAVPFVMIRRCRWLRDPETFPPETESPCIPRSTRRMQDRTSLNASRAGSEPSGDHHRHAQWRLPAKAAARGQFGPGDNNRAPVALGELVPTWLLGSRGSSHGPSHKRSAYDQFQPRYRNDGSANRAEVRSCRNRRRMQRGRRQPLATLVEPKSCDLENRRADLPASFGGSGRLVGEPRSPHVSWALRRQRRHVHPLRAGIRRLAPAGRRRAPGGPCALWA